MVYYLESDYIIAKLLEKKEIGESISIKDMVGYKNLLMSKIEDDLRVDISDASIISTLESYPELFKMIGDNVYKIADIDMKVFNNLLPNRLVEILNE